MDIVQRRLSAKLGTSPGRERNVALRLLGVVGFAAAAYSLPAAGAEQPGWKLQTDRAYLSVYAYHCAPSLFAKEATERVDAMEVAIYQSRFRHEYGGDCRAFYLAEIVSRLDSAK